MSDYPRVTQTQHVTEHGYSVEARLSDGLEPRQVVGEMLSQKWTRIRMYRAPAGYGVPSSSEYHAPILAMTNLLGYSAAQALRWWFHANADASREMLGGLGVETRLVKHKIEHSFTVTALSAHVPIGGEDRSNVRPDWGIVDATESR